MPAYRPDRVVKMLTTLVSVAYFGLCVAGALALIAAPAAKLWADGDRHWVWGLKVPATVLDSNATVLTSWGPAELEVDAVRGDLRLPIAMLPWWLVAVLWTHAAVAIGLLLLFLYHLRRLFQRVRDGAPFDAHNARRLRWLGLLLLALTVFNGVAESATALVVGKGLASRSVAVTTGLHIDGWAVLAALVLVALAEIFRRGAELEHEQSLVV